MRPPPWCRPPLVSGVLFLCEWLLRSTSPTIAAVVVYLHISGAGAAAGLDSG